MPQIRPLLTLTLVHTWYEVFTPGLIIIPSYYSKYCINVTNPICLAQY